MIVLFYLMGFAHIFFSFSSSYYIVAFITAVLSFISLVFVYLCLSFTSTPLPLL